MFGGREKDIFGISDHFGRPETNVVIIEGESGIGKTALLNAYMSQIPDDDFIRVVSVTEPDWLTLLLELARILIPKDEFPKKAKAKDLSWAILKVAKRERVFVGLDDVDEAHQGLVQFISDWEDATDSQLLITTKDFSSLGSLPKNCCIYKLHGIEHSHQHVIKSLLGADVFALLNKCDLWQALDKLGGNPQKLKYVGWQAPESCKALKACIEALAEADGTSSEPSKGRDARFYALENVLRRIALPVDHFLALGRVRTATVDEALLAHLWEQLGLGGTELYARSQHALVQKERLLETGTVETGTDGRLRVHPSVHVQLESQFVKTLETRIRRSLRKLMEARSLDEGQFDDHLKAMRNQQINYIDYYIGEYYGRRFSAKSAQTHRLQDLERYVYHMLQSGNLDGAYSYVLVEHRADILQSEPLAEFERTLEHFEKAFEILSKQRKPSSADGQESDMRRKLMEARVKIEMGRVMKDLSKHEDCLARLNDAAVILDSAVPAKDHADGEVSAGTRSQSSLAVSLRITVDHYRGIAYSQMGRTSECIDAYKNSIEKAKELTGNGGPGVPANPAPRWFSSMEALSLGYLAYELKFHLMAEAIEIGKRAVDLAVKIGDKDIVAKNLCNLCLTQAFANHLGDSETSYHEAHKLYGFLDTRTRGRISVNSSVCFIAAQEWEQAGRILDEAHDAFGDSGDRRRKAMGLAYRGIIKHHRDGYGKGVELLEKAFREHVASRAMREMLYEALTLQWMRNRGGEMDGWDVVRAEGRSPELQKCVDEFSVETLKVFADFWTERYQPALLTLAWEKR